ncbi:diguanylate cyclase [Shewanella vesiculosa]|uniref:diguanylate cyclase n=1 Tax=Shewanella vesiculosa TaxID=518738 RepID=A0ABV0FPE8_9GAMM|nr:diguanylate cyclase [Shewanella sp. SG44-6]MBB1388389.1 diguanylate cyclase [Shewanella sp. SG44-6]
MPTLKLSSIIHIIMLVCAIGFSSIAYANPVKNLRADEIYTLLDSGNFISDEDNRKLLSEYKSILSDDDIIRQELYIRLNCWSLPANTTEEMQAAVKYADKYLQIYRQPAPSLIQIDLQYCKAWFLYAQGESDSLFADLNTAILNAYKLEDPRLIADGRSTRGAILSYLGNFSEALEDLITAQNLYESLNLTYWANVNLGELANSYRRFGDARTALTYQIKLENSYLKNKQIYEANLTNNQIALSLEKLERYEEAIERFQKTRDFWLTENNPIAAADASISIAGNLISLNRLKDAEVILHDAQKVITPKNDNSYSYMNLFMAKVHYQQELYQQALIDIDQAEKAFNFSNNIRGLNQVLQLKSEIYQASQQWQLAYETLKLFVESHLSYDKKVLSERNAEMQARFDNNKIQTENTMLIQRDKEKQLQLDIMKRNEDMQIIIISLVAIILVIVSIFAYKQLLRKRLFRRLALTDELTKVANRRDSHSQGNYFLKIAQQSSTPLSLISFDADNFKAVNDTLGHDMGDKVLVKLAAISTSMMRDTDVIGRVGGEEFLILLPNIDKAKAIEIANRLVETIAKYDWSQISPNLHQTISAGVASYTNETELSPLLLKADKALYSAKAAGRNCVKAE